MKCKTSAVVSLVAALAIALPLTAREDQEDPKYKVVDLGTFGGPQSYLNFYAQVLNKEGAMAGWGDTLSPDPNFPNFGSCLNPDCFLSHAFEWHSGARTELGALPGGGTSQANWISDNGLIAGTSENGLVDPITGGREQRAVLWEKGSIIDLGTLGGNESFSAAVSSRGQIVGAASNATPDSFSFFGWGTQSRAFLWYDGVMHDLGTLGGPDAIPGNVNERGQVSGCSYTNSTPNSVTGIPTLEPFLWDDGKMVGLGTLGGTSGCANYLNNEGEVVGVSNLTGDTATHPFLWKNGKIIDLGTFGGTVGQAIWINDAGWIIGDANYAGDKIHRAALWKNGELFDLGVVYGDKCSTAWGINAKGQVVGASGDCGIGVHAFLWEEGHMVDLTGLIPPGVELTYGLNINERGEIAAVGRVPGCGDTGCQHAFLLMPIDHVEDTTEVTPSVMQTSTAPATTQPQVRRKIHN